MATPAPKLSKVIESGAGYLIANTADGKSVKLVGNYNWRNNNPGNLRVSSFTKAQPGYIGVGGGFAVFDSYENGSKAQQNLLFKSPSYQSLSIASGIARYAPPSENNTQGYINDITNALGVPASTPLASLTPDQQRAMIKAMERVEGYITGRVEVVSTAPVTPTEPPAEAVTELPEVTVTANRVEKEKIITKPIMNRLHKYPSYIYGLSLHLLSDEEYNNVVIEQKYTPTNVLVASAGRHGATFPRNKFFQEDFYFENFEMTTIIAPNDYSRNTNAIECSFTLIEPYGFTFIERLLKAAEDINSKNYLDMPYLIQIDFYAINDAGDIVGSIDELKKRFPVKIAKLDIKADNGGARYSINALPFNHSALDSTTISTPANFEITASTVGNFFQSIEGTNADTFQQATKVQANNQRETTEKNSLGTAPVKLSANSYGTAINSWYSALVASHKISEADVYRFEFNPDPDTGVDVISTAKFVNSTTNTPKETPMSDTEMRSGEVKMRRANAGENCSIYSPEEAIFSINYGTTIDKLLEYVIRSSSYIQDQLVIPDGMSQTAYNEKKLALKDKPLNWFKITTKVRLLRFDNIRKIWAREITYVVTPYKMYNIRSDVGPQGVQLFPVKAYNYLYTGKNDDILNFDLQFNALYYNQSTAYRDNLSELSPTAESKTTNYEYQNAPNWSGQTTPKGIDANAVMPMVMKPVVQNSRAVATGNPSTAIDVAASDLADSLMTNSEADMLKLTMTIIGDPDFIKQDDIFYNNPPIISNSGALGSDPRLLLNNGSLVMDKGALYAQVIFRTPRDINENTGLMEFDSATKKSIFSGLYLILTVKSRFAGGSFTQEITGTRASRQIDFDYTSGASDSTVSENRPPQSATVDKNGTYTPGPIIPSILVSNPPKKNTADDADVVITKLPAPEPIIGTPNKPSDAAANLAKVRLQAKGR
jgi:hypothetical protein